MRAEIAALHRRLGNTVVYVTHDQIEAMTLADRIVVLRDGRIEQAGTPRELYANPANVFVAQFIGSPKMNVLPIERLAGRIGASPPGAARVGLRPEHLRLASPNRAVLSGTVAISEYTGSASLLHIDVDGGERCLILVEDATRLEVGTPVTLGIEAENLRFFDHSGNLVRAS